MNPIKTVSIIGLGAIGSYIASQLSPILGNNLRVIAGGQRKKRLEHEGMIINGVPFHFHVVSPDETTGYADLAIIITKFHQLGQALKDIRNQIGPDTIIMAPLNGIESEEIVASVYGWERVLYSLARISIVRTGNQTVFTPHTGILEFGERTNEILSERVERVLRLFELTDIKTQTPEDMQRALWLKYLSNVSENQISAVLNLTYGDWKSNQEDMVRLKELVMQEVVSVAQKKGINLTVEDIKQRLFIKTRYAPSDNRPSTLQDLEAGRKTEVDIFAGTMVRMGKETKVPTPMNEFLYHAIKVLEYKSFSNPL